VNPAQALHCAARQYCNQQYAFWCDEYSRVPNKGRAADGYNYSPKALDTFPRYNMINAIRVEVERIDPATLIDFEEAKRSVVNAGSQADDDFTRSSICEIDAAAMDDEREKFCRFVDSLTEEDVTSVDPISYRRVLGSEEASAVWAGLAERWNISQRSYWYPLIEFSHTNVVAYDAESFHNAVPAHAIVRNLHKLGVERVWELREFGPEYEQDIELLDPYYNGAEGFWTSAGFNWIIYASHESSITVGGELLDFVRQSCPKWNSHRWNT